MLETKDAVRVRSYWGGLTALEAKWFQNQLPKESNGFTFEIAPLRFRYNLDPFQEASECCLIYADRTYYIKAVTLQSWVFVLNPHVRVAYDRSTLW